MLRIEIVQQGAIALSPEEGVTDWRPTCSLLDNDGFRVLVDLEHPKEDGSAFKNGLRRLGLGCSDIHGVIFTHLHPDHIGHKDLLPRAVFMFHQAERLAFFFQNDRTVQLEGSALIELCPRGFEQPVYVSGVPDLAALGNRVYIHHTPGHTEGSTVPFAKVDGQVYAFAGDTFLNEGYFDRWQLPGSSWSPELIPEHMELVRARADIIVPGHGPPFEARRRLRGGRWAHADVHRSSSG